VLLSPAEGAVLTTYPRTATLTWQAVSTAASYTVEVQCLHCAVVGQYTHGGQRDRHLDLLRHATVPGDNEGRWRVTAINAGGTAGPPSAWRSFSFRTG
jgi:hypothetical protein